MKILKKNGWKIFIIIVILLTIFRVWLQYNTPLYYIGTSPHDDDLLQYYSYNMATGHWLGTYNNRTLVKGITYSVFLILVLVTRIPYAIILAIVNILAAFLFVRAIKPLIKNKYFLGILYLFLIYSPVTMDWQVSQRLYRNCLTFPLSFLTLAGFIGTYLNINNGKKSIKWAILAGISIFAFWNLREDTIWIMPFCIVASIISVIVILLKVFKDKYKKGLLKIFIVILPYIILLLGNGVICLLNYHCYGIFALNDRTGTSFSELMSLMVKIDYEDSEDIDEKSIIISKDKLEYICDNSESLSEIKENILNYYEAWAVASGQDNVPGDIYVWALRDGLDASGYFTDGSTLTEFCKQVINELEEKIDNGELELADGMLLSSSTRLFKLEELPEVLSDTFESTYDLSTFKSAKVVYLSSGGTDERIREVELLTNSLLIHHLKDSSSIEQFNNIASKIVDFENNIIKVYKKVVFPLLIVGLVCYGIITILQIKNIKVKNAEFFNRWLILTGVLFSGFLLLVAVTFFIKWLPKDDYLLFYASGSIPLIQVFELISIYTFISYIVNVIKNRKKEKNKDSSTDTML